MAAARSYRTRANRTMTAYSAGSAARSRPRGTGGLVTARAMSVRAFMRIHTTLRQNSRQALVFISLPPGGRQPEGTTIFENIWLGR